MKFDVRTLRVSVSKSTVSCRPCAFRWLCRFVVNDAAAGTAVPSVCGKTLRASNGVQQT